MVYEFSSRSRLRRIRLALVGATAALALIIHATPLAAQTDDDGDAAWYQIANEYFATAAVYPQERGETQLSLIPRFTSFDGGSEVQAGLAVEYGITDRWQVELEWAPWVRLSPDHIAATSGPGPIEIGARRAFMALGDGALHVSAGLDVGIPVGDVDDGLSDGLLEIEPSVVVARDLGTERPAQLFAQAGVGFVDRVQDPSDPQEAEPTAHEVELAVGAALALGVPRVTLELSRSSNRWDGGDERETYVTPGVVFVLDSGLEIGLGASFGIADDSEGVTTLIAYLIREF